MKTCKIVLSLLFFIIILVPSNYSFAQGNDDQLHTPPIEAGGQEDCHSSYVPCIDPEDPEGKTQGAVWCSGPEPCTEGPNRVKCGGVKSECSFTN